MCSELETETARLDAADDIQKLTHNRQSAMRTTNDMKCSRKVDCRMHTRLTYDISRTKWSLCVDKARRAEGAEDIDY